MGVGSDNHPIAIENRVKSIIISYYLYSLPPRYEGTYNGAQKQGQVRNKDKKEIKTFYPGVAEEGKARS